MTPEQIQDLIDTLLNMGETMATEAFRASMEYTLVQAWVIGIAAIGVLVVGIVGARALKDEGGEEVVWLVTFLFFLILGYEFAIRMFSPEWISIRRILELIKY